MLDRLHSFFPALYGGLAASQLRYVPPKRRSRCRGVNAPA